jgi:hypothetical protein
MPLFISYRRDDSGGHAGRLYDTLGRAGGGVVIRENIVRVAVESNVESLQDSVLALIDVS